VKKDLDLIILAAGKSSRFGSLKGFAKIKESTLLESAITLHQNNFTGKTIVVFSNDSLEYKIRLEKRYSEVLFVENPTPENGPFSSLKIGLEVTTSSHIFMLPVDCPCRNLHTWLQLSENTSSQSMCIKPSMNGKGGHPIIITSELKSIIENAPSKDNLKNILHNLDFTKIQYIEVNDSDVIKNINTLEDLRS